MANIFISYRREDTSVFAGRIYDRLSGRFGEEHNIFMDVDTLEPGLDFVDAIEEAVESCDALIAVIGERWFGPEENRLEDPEDLVRVEVVAALKRKVRVIPVLIEGASMPKSKDRLLIVPEWGAWRTPCGFRSE